MLNTIYPLASQRASRPRPSVVWDTGCEWVVSLRTEWNGKQRDKVDSTIIGIEIASPSQHDGRGRKLIVGELFRV
jgi:hypothetical protein